MAVLVPAFRVTYSQTNSVFLNIAQENKQQTQSGRTDNSMARGKSHQFSNKDNILFNNLLLSLSHKQNGLGFFVLFGCFLMNNNSSPEFRSDLTSITTCSNILTSVHRNMQWGRMGKYSHRGGKDTLFFKGKYSVTM